MELPLYIIIILALSIVVLGIFVIILYKRLSALSAGNHAKSLESVIIQTNNYVKLLTEQQEATTLEIEKLKEDAQHNIQHIGTVRFNPFKETGGNQSFAIALTDKLKNGIVLSSLFTRDRVNVFVKPVQKGNSQYVLTEEEQKALHQSYQ